MDLKLAGKRAVVTGGTRGIGRAIVEAFVDEGTHVAFCARTADDVAAAEKALSERGGTVFGTVLDVGQADALTAWVARAGEQLGGIDILVANISALAIPESEENWQASFDVDLMHTVRLVTTSMPLLEQSENGAIVAVSSVSARDTDFAAGPYATMKTALVGYMHGLAYIWPPKGSGRTPSPRATRSSPAASGRTSRRTCPMCTRPSSRSTPPAGWALRRR
jgi:NAD(P)-dependent dehydrogenase (short-subunit alcohol dehydrogenase family)